VFAALWATCSGKPLFLFMHMKALETLQIFVKFCNVEVYQS
jgi:hypothetical protein